MFYTLTPNEKVQQFSRVLKIKQSLKHSSAQLALTHTSSSMLMLYLPHGPIPPTQLMASCYRVFAAPYVHYSLHSVPTWSVPIQPSDIFSKLSTETQSPDEVKYFPLHALIVPCRYLSQNLSELQSYMHLCDSFISILS